MSKKFSELDPVSGIQADDIIPITRPGVGSRRISGAAIISNLTDATAKADAAALSANTAATIKGQIDTIKSNIDTIAANVISADSRIQNALTQFISGHKVNVPATETTAGAPGQYALDANFHYVYTGNGTTHSWIRRPIRIPATTAVNLANTAHSVNLAWKEGAIYRLTDTNQMAYSRGTGQTTVWDVVSMATAITPTGTLAAPVASTSIGHMRIQEKTGAVQIPTASMFTGTVTTYSLPTAVAGVTIDSATGVVTIADNAARRAAATVTVRAANATNGVNNTFQLSVGPQIGFAIPIDRLVEIPLATVDVWLNRIKSLNGTYVRYDFEFIDALRTGNVNQKNIQEITKKVVAAGLTPVILWKGSNTWTEAEHIAKVDEVRTFAQLAGTVFKNLGAHYHEILNEPNLDSFASIDVSRAALMGIIGAISDGIFSVDEDCWIIGPGLSPVPTPTSAPDFAVPAKAFTEALYAAGLKDKTDFFAIHPYSYPHLPSETQGWNGWHISTTEIRAVMVANGDSGKQMWMTEFGAPTYGTKPGTSISAALQSTHLQEAWDEGAATTWIGPLLWYTLFDTTVEGTDDTELYFGAVKSDGTDKPVTNLMRNIKRGNYVIPPAA